MLVKVSVPRPVSWSAVRVKSTSPSSTMASMPAPPVRVSLPSPPVKRLLEIPGDGCQVRRHQRPDQHVVAGSAVERRRRRG